ncbi:MAG: ADOP family duplicated permease [Candidatus Acidiferrales bacterium]
MNWWGRLFRKNQVERELDAELRDHIERAVAENLRKGMNESEARRAARLTLGGLEQTKEECREARGTLWLENILQDIRYAFRTLRKNRGFAAAAICTLALGIGANTAMFDVINGVLLRPLPYKDPGRLVEVSPAVRTGQLWSFAYPEYRDVALQSRSFQSIAAWRDRGANLSAPGNPAFLPVLQVSASFLDVLGIRPILGRSFDSEEDRRGASPVAILSYSFWRERFGGQRNAIGSRIVLDGKGYTVIGILPAGFRFIQSGAVLIPIGQVDEIWKHGREHFLPISAIARLKAGINLHQANAELSMIGERLARAYPTTDANFTFRALPLKKQFVGNVGPILLLLGGAVGLVLLIACVNVANLFLARSTSREREFALRAALGAGRWRLARQLFTESLLLSFAGGAAGLLIAAAGTRWAIAHLPQWLPRTNDISLDVRVLLFAIGASLISGIAFGLAPVFRKGSSLEAALREGARGSSGGVRQVQGVFVIAELALAFLLLAGTGLMLRTILQLSSVSPGFDPHNVLTMAVALPAQDAKSPALTRSGFRRILSRVQNTPGVEAAALDSLVPMTGDSQSIAYWTTAAAKPPHNAPRAICYTPTPGYLKTMRIPLLRGRFFTKQDRLGSPPVIVIDETLARKLFPDSDPVGKELSVQFWGKARIVGVVAAIKHHTLDEDAYAPPQPAVYVPFFQFPDSLMPLTATGMNLLVRTSISPLSVLQAVKKSAVGPAGDAPVRDAMSMEQLIGYSIVQRKGIAFLLAIFAGIALALAAIGIYSVISYSMSRRVQEIGIRMALGAQPRQVLRLVLGQGLRMLAIGIALGLAVSFAVTRLLSKLLFDVAPDDPLTFAVVVLALGAIALLAVYFPARRAARLDPMLALRHE